MPRRLRGRYGDELECRASPASWCGEMVVANTEHGNAGHVVQFYGHEEELADRVAAYLREALDDGGVTIVIATQAHRRSFESRLTSVGIDLAAAGRRGAYLALDADETV